MKLAQRSVGLDLLRALAVLLVLGRHMNPPAQDEHGMVRAVADVWIRGGWIGVDLFFVLSGFLIGGLLFQEHLRHGTIDVRRFLVRRGFKIYPAFYAFLAITVLYIRVRYGGFPRKSQMLGDALFIQNYANSLWHHTWSLAVEEHFYILLPALLAGMLRRNNRAAATNEPSFPLINNPFRNLPRHFLLWALVLFVVRCVNAALRPFDYKTHTFPTHLRMDSLMFGVVLAYWSVYHGPRLAALVDRFRWLLAPCAVGLLAPQFVLDLGPSPYIHTFGYTACYLGSGALLLLVVHSRSTPGRFLRAVAYLGAFSYSIYLWHLAVRLWGVPHLEQLLGVQFSFLTATAAYMIGSVLVGIAMAAIIEYPALRIRDRLYPSRSKPTLAVGTEPANAPLRRAA
jgi:peptidoglycan/LPS O-acetylase OafA/YrhL